MRRKKTIGQSIADELKQFSRDVKHGKKFWVSRFDAAKGKFVRKQVTVDEVIQRRREEQ